MAVKAQKVRISSYIRNVGRSFGYAVGDVAGSYAPTLKSIVDDSKTAIDDAKMSSSDLKSSIKNMINEYKTGVVANTLDDLKTGNWYNKKREEEALNDMFGGGFDFDDDWGDWDDSSDDSDFSDSSDDTRDTKAIINSIDSVGENISKNVAYSNARSAEYIVANQKASTRAMYELTGKGFNQVSGILMNMSHTMVGLASLGEPLSQHIQNSGVFYTKTTESLERINSSLDKLVERTAYMDEMNKKQSGNRKKSIHDVVSGGEFSLSSYFELVKENTKEQLEMVSGFKDMFEMMGGKGGKNASLAKLIPEMMIKSVMPKFFKTTLEQFNETINNALVNGLMRGSRAAAKSNNPLINILGSFLFPEFKMKKGIDSSKYDRGPMQWDGEAKKALTRVIPDYLAKIYEALTGSPAQHFNYKTGKYETLKDIRDERSKFISDQGKSATRDLKREMTRGKSAAEAAEIENQMDAFIAKALMSSDFSMEDFFRLEKASPEAITAFRKKFGISDKLYREIKEINKKANSGHFNKNRNLMGNFERQFYDAQLRISNEFQNQELMNGSWGLLGNGNFLNGGNVVGYGGGNRKGKGSSGVINPIDIIDYATRKRNYKAEKLDNEAKNKNKSVYKIDRYTFELSDKELDALEKELDKLGSDEEKDRFLQTKSGQQLASTAKDYLFSNNKKGEEKDESNFSRGIKAIKHFWEKPFYAVSMALDNLSKGVNDLFYGENGILDKLKDTWGSLKDKIKEFFPDDAEKKKETMKQSMGKELKNLGRKAVGAIMGKDFLASADKWKYVRDRREAFNKQYLETEAERDEFGESGTGSGLIYKLPRHSLYSGGESGLEFLGKSRDGIRYWVNKAGKVFIKKGKGFIAARVNRDQADEINEMLGNQVTEARGEMIDAAKNSKPAQTIAEGGKILYGGLTKFFNQVAYGDKADSEDVEKQKKNVFDSLSKTMKDLPGAKGAIGLGAVGGVGVSLLTGALVGPIAGAALGAGIGLATKSQAFQDFLFGKGDPDDPEYKKGLLGEFGKALKADGFQSAKKVGIGAGAGATAGMVMGSPIVGAILGGAAGYVASSEKAQKMLFGEGDQKTMLGKAKDEIKKRFPNMTAGMIAGLVAGPFGLAGNLALGAGLGYISTSDKFKNFMFGDPNDKNDKGLAGKIHDRIMNPLNEIMHNIANISKNWAKRLFTSLGGTLKNWGKGLLGILGRTKIGQKAKGAGKLATGAINGVVDIAGNLLGAPNRKLQKIALNSGADVYDAELGRNRTFAERNQLRNLIKNGNVQEVTDEEGNVIGYEKVDPFSGKRKSITKDEYEKIKQRASERKGWKEDSKAGSFEQIMAQMSQEGRLKDLDLSDMDSVRGSIAKFASEKGFDKDLTANALKFTKNEISTKDLILAEMKLQEKISKENEEKQNEFYDNQADFNKQIADNLYNGPESIKTKVANIAEDLGDLVSSLGRKAAKGAKAVGGKLKDAMGEPESDGIHEASIEFLEGKGSGLRALRRFSGGASNEETRTEFDAFGNPHQYVRNGQGEWVEQTSDKETVRSRKIMDKFSESLSSLPLIGSVLGGLKGLKNLFGGSEEGKEKKKGFFESLADFLDPDSENSGWAKMANFLSSGKSWLKTAGGNIMGFAGLASIGLAIGGLSGKLNGVANSLVKAVDKDDNTTSHGRMNSGSKTATLEDGSKVELQVDSTTGEAVTDESGNYLDNNGNAVSPNDVQSISSTQNRSLSKGLWKNMAIKTARNVAKGKKAVGGLAAGMIKGGAKAVKASAKVAGTKFNKIAKGGKAVASAAKKGFGVASSRFKDNITGIKYLAGNTKVGKAAAGVTSKLTEKLGGFMTKIGEILSKVLKKFKIDAPTDKIDDLVSSLTKTFTTKIDDMGAKAAKGFSDAIPVIGQAIWVADMVVTGTNAWGDAENILGIIEEATTGEKIIATLIALINEGIPVIGGIIPHDVMASLIIGIFERMGWFKEDIANLREKQAKAREVVDQYNSENGTTYTVEEYNLNVNDEVKSGWWTSAKHKVSSWWDTKKNDKKKSEEAAEGSGLIHKLPSHSMSSGFKRTKTFKPSFRTAGGASGVNVGPSSGIFNTVFDNFDSNNMLSGIGLNPDDMKSFTNQINKMSEMAKNGDLQGISDDVFKMTASMKKSPLSKFFDIGFRMAKSFNSMGGIFDNILKPVGEVTGEFTDSAQTIGDKFKNIASTTWDKIKETAKSFWSGLFGNKDESSTSSDTAGGASGFISQFDPSLQRYKVSGANFASKGCGPAVAAMTASALGKNLSVGSAVNASQGYQVGNGVTLDYFQQALGSQGIDTQYIAGGGAGDLYSSIASGKKVILLGQDASNTSKDYSPFGPNNHYVVATGLDRAGNVVVNDPELNGPTTYSPGILNSVKYGVAAGRSGLRRRARRLPRLIRRLAGGGNPRNDATTQAIWAYLTNNLAMSEAAAAGVMGNMEAESGCNPDVKQKGGSAYGLCQWDGERRDNLKKQANYQSLGVQLAFLASELPSQYWKKSGNVTDYKSGKSYSYSSMTYGEFKALTDVATATIKFEAAFERAGKPNIEDRINWAKAYYEMFSGKTYEVPADVSSSTLSETVTTTTESTDSETEDSSIEKPKSIFDVMSSVSSLFKDAFTNALNPEEESANSESTDTDSSTGTSVASTVATVANPAAKSVAEIAKQKITEIPGGKAAAYPQGNKNAQSVVDIARSQLGVTEAGDNITDYGKFTGTDGKAWCAAFASWVYDKAFNGDTAARNKALHGGISASVSTLLDQFNKDNAVFQTPEPGDLVLYKNGTSHVGIVEAVDGNTVYTIEGNTTPDKSFNRDGGSVYRKSFDYTNKSSGKGAKLTGFGRPNWSAAAAGSGLLSYSQLANKSGGSSGVLMRSRAGSAGAKPAFVDPTTGRIVPFTRFAGGATNIADASKNMLNQIATSAASNNNTGKGISPELVSQLLSAITSILEKIADNTTPINRIYQALAAYLESGGASGIDNKSNQIININRAPQKAAAGGGDEIDPNIKSLVATLAELAKG